MLLGNQPKTNTHNPLEQHDEWIVQLLSNNQYVEAYRLLKSEPPQKISTLFNLAICLFFTKDYESCLRNLDEISTKLQPDLTDDFYINDNLYKKLENIQYADNSYLQGITDKYVQYFPQIAKKNVLRIKIDCYRVLCKWNKVIELAAPLKGFNYQNVEDALNDAHLNTR